MSNGEQQLLELWRRLPASEQRSLLDYAEFLVQRSGTEVVSEIAEPVPVPRPERESVVGAIKRLSSVYHMVDRSKILHQTSALMSEHMLQGRAADEVIDDLEILFLRHYEKQFKSDEQ